MAFKIPKIKFKPKVRANKPISNPYTGNKVPYRGTGGPRRTAATSQELRNATVPFRNSTGGAMNTSQGVGVGAQTTESILALKGNPATGTLPDGYGPRRGPYQGADHIAMHNATTPSVVDGVVMQPGTSNLSQTSRPNPTFPTGSNKYTPPNAETKTSGGWSKVNATMPKRPTMNPTTGMGPRRSAKGSKRRNPFEGLKGTVDETMNGSGGIGEMWGGLSEGQRTAAIAGATAFGGMALGAALSGDD